MKKSGFTLIELLATIVILSSIAIIAVSSSLGAIKSSKEKSYTESVKLVIDSVKYYLVSNNLDKLSEDGVLVSNLNLNNEQQLVSGKIYLNDDGQYRAVSVYNGEFCATGTKDDLKIADKCYLLDDTDPLIDVNKINIVSTTSSLKVIVPKIAITEIESEIVSYTFELINENLGINKKVTVDENNYIFTSLKNETEYKIVVTVTNQNDLSSTVETKGSTAVIDVPTYSVDKTGFATSKTVNVIYPERQEGFIYSYSLDNGKTWIAVDNSRTVNVVFNSNGTIIAKVYDGTNYVTASSYTVSGIDTTKPTTSISTSNEKTDRVTIIADCVDSESGIVKYEFSKDNGSTWISNGLTNSYTFTGLIKGTNYVFGVRCTNGSGLTNSITNSATTSNMTNPTIAQLSQTPSSGYSYAISRVIGITYKSTNIASPAYYFKSSVAATVSSGVVTASCGTSTNPGTCTASSVTTLLAGTWYKTSSMTPTVTNTTNGTLYALTSDGTNVSGTSTFSITKMDTTAPSAAISVSSVVSSGTVSSTLTATCTDSESGITKYEFSEDNGTTWVANGTTKTYAFTGLKGSTSYTFGTRCTNGSGLVSSVAKTTVTTPAVNYAAVLACTNGRTLSGGNCIYQYTNNESKCGCSTYNSCATTACGVSSYKTCSNSACGTKSCSTSACGVSSYNTCSNSACGCATYKCTLYKSCQITVTGGNICSERKPSDNATTTFNCTYTAGYYCCISKTVTTGRNSACGTETVTGSECNNANSKTCVTYNSCQTSACGVSSYKTCSNSACGYNSCQTSACGVSSYKTCTNSACGCKTASSCTKTENEYKVYTCPNGGTLSGTTCVF
ncbi:MAG: prepilin-type N-terminal cleavage/methylation domain-containing protein [Bacilli bacterium]